MLTPTLGSLIDQYTIKIEQTKKLIQKIKLVSSTLTYQGIQRVNKVAFLQVKAKHTNQFTVYLGCDYYAQVRAEQAIKLFQYRLQEYQSLLSKIQAQTNQINNKQNKNSLGTKQSTDLVQKTSNKNGSYLEVIGEQNGQNIYNIIQIQGEQQQSHLKVEPQLKQTNKALSQLMPSQLKSYNKQQKIQQDIVTNQPQNKQHNAQAGRNQSTEVQQAAVKNNESSEQQQDDSDRSEEGQQDLIKNYWNKKVNISLKTELPPISEKQQIKSTEALNPALLVKSDKQYLPKQKKSQQKLQVIKPLPAKISKFKLQKMREKLQKQ